MVRRLSPHDARGRGGPCAGFGIDDRLPCSHSPVAADAQCRAWVELVGSLLLLLPFSLLGLLISLRLAWNSWGIGETSPNPDGLPCYLVKSLIPLCFLLLSLQGLAQALLAWNQLRTDPPYPDPHQRGF